MGPPDGPRADPSGAGRSPTLDLAPRARAAVHRPRHDLQVRRPLGAALVDAAPDDARLGDRPAPPERARCRRGQPVRRRAEAVPGAGRSAAPPRPRAGAERRRRGALDREPQRRRRLRRARRGVVHDPRPRHGPQRGRDRRHRRPERQRRAVGARPPRRRRGDRRGAPLWRRHPRRRARGGVGPRHDARPREQPRRDLRREGADEGDREGSPARRHDRRHLRPRRLRRANAHHGGDQPRRGTPHRHGRPRDHARDDPRRARHRDRHPGVDGDRALRDAPLRRHRRPDEPRRHRLRLPRRRSDRGARGGHRGDRRPEARRQGARAGLRRCREGRRQAGRLRGRDHHARIHPAPHARGRRGQDVPTDGDHDGVRALRGARLFGGLLPCPPRARGSAREGTRSDVARAARARLRGPRRASGEAPLAARRGQRGRARGHQRPLRRRGRGVHPAYLRGRLRPRDATRPERVARGGASSRPPRREGGALLPGGRQGARPERPRRDGARCRRQQQHRHPRPAEASQDLDERAELRGAEREAEGQDRDRGPVHVRLRLAADRRPHEPAHRRLPRRRVDQDRRRRSREARRPLEPRRRHRARHPRDRRPEDRADPRPAEHHGDRRSRADGPIRSEGPACVRRPRRLS